MPPVLERVDASIDAKELAQVLQRDGATAVVPGSHLWPSERVPESGEVLQGQMKPGSALFYLGTTRPAAAPTKPKTSGAGACCSVTSLVG